jgi:tetratricopeptide (TPR) repeat protein
LAAEKGQKLSSKMKPLGEAQALMGEKKWKEALAVINDKVVPIQGKSAYEEAITNEMKAYCLAQLRDYAGAAKIYETMLAANQIPADQIAGKVLIISQAAFQQKDYAKSIQFAERYVKEAGPNAEVLQQLAQAYYLKGEYKQSADYANKLIKQAEQAKKTPEKIWLELLMGSQYKLDDKAGLVSTLEDLLTYYPSQQYWKDIFKYLNNAASYSERESIEIYRLKKTLGIMIDDDYKQMTELSLAMTTPGDAKAALEAGLSSGVVKSDERINRLLNRAKADAAADLATIDNVAKEAQSKGNVEALAKIGAAYLGHGQNDKAVATIQAAIAKGGLKAVDESYVRLGAAYYNLGNKAEAIKAFQKVSDSSNLARLARLWIIHTKK